ncbi:LAFE_0C05974g1_1 [Lachancea fermentati]|uniref:methylated diphthine methylhydrolase n=1 Tax=Lachancea fermentati TaxID=4955 RepID=A0A1G4M9H2_LACFM|nr:LAFE_0C05974g1_1 [Lachancea fermentati]
MSIEESKAIKSCKAQQPPCCLRIFDDRYIILGTYDLDKPTGIRTGSVEVYDNELQLLKTYKTYGAILDLKLSPFDPTLMATAHSTGNITLWRIRPSPDDAAITLDEISNLQVFESDNLITSLHFSPLRPEIVVVTTTSGEVKAVELAYETEVFSSEHISAHYANVERQSCEVQGQVVSYCKSKGTDFLQEHSLESWTAEFGTLSPFENVLFSGGDDSTIIAHDLRTGNSVWSNSRIHEAGLVAIKCSTPTFRSHMPTSIITGSYDDKIRSLELRMMGTSIYPGINVPVLNSADCNLGGGVWRFVESPKNSSSPSHNDLLVCCMYNGSKILSVSGDQFKTTHFIKNGHDSMCYGGDWGRNFIGTCSFYDKTVQLWTENP